MTKKIIIAVAALAVALTVRAQTNVVFGDVGDLGLTPVAGEAVTMSPLLPGPQFAGKTWIKPAPIAHYTDANGRFYFTNVPAGKWSWDIEGSTVIGWVYTNTTGSWNMNDVGTNAASYVAPPYFVNGTNVTLTTNGSRIAINAVGGGGSGTATNLDGFATNQVIALVAGATNAFATNAYAVTGPQADVIASALTNNTRGATLPTARLDNPFLIGDGYLNDTNGNGVGIAINSDGVSTLGAFRITDYSPALDGGASVNLLTLQGGSTSWRALSDFDIMLGIGVPFWVGQNDGTGSNYMKWQSNSLSLRTTNGGSLTWAPNGNLTNSGTIAASNFVGSIDASQLASGTVPTNRLPLNANYLTNVTLGVGDSIVLGGQIKVQTDSSQVKLYSPAFGRIVGWLGYGGVPGFAASLPDGFNFSRQNGIVDYRIVTNGVDGLEIDNGSFGNLRSLSASNLYSTGQLLGQGAQNIYETNAAKFNPTGIDSQAKDDLAYAIARERFYGAWDSVVQAQLFARRYGATNHQAVVGTNWTASGEVLSASGMIASFTNTATVTLPSRLTNFSVSVYFKQDFLAAAGGLLKSDQGLLALYDSATSNSIVLTGHGVADGQKIDSSRGTNFLYGYNAGVNSTNQLYRMQSGYWATALRAAPLFPTVVTISYNSNGTASAWINGNPSVFDIATTNLCPLFALTNGFDSLIVGAGSPAWRLLGTGGNVHTNVGYAEIYGVVLHNQSCEQNTNIALADFQWLTTTDPKPLAMSLVGASRVWHPAMDYATSTSAGFWLTNDASLLYAQMNPNLMVFQDGYRGWYLYAYTNMGGTYGGRYRFRPSVANLAPTKQKFIITPAGDNDIIGGRAQVTVQSDFLNFFEPLRTNDSVAIDLFMRGPTALGTGPQNAAIKTYYEAVANSFPVRRKLDEWYYGSLNWMLAVSADGTHVGFTNTPTGHAGAVATAQLWTDNTMPVWSPQYAAISSGVSQGGGTNETQFSEVSFLVRTTNGTTLGTLDGSGLTNLNASSLASGTVPTNRLPGQLPALATSLDWQTTNISGSKVSAVIAGDSLSSGYLSVTNYSIWLTNTYGYSFGQFTNTAVAGQTAATILANYQTQIGQFAPGVGTNGLAFLWCGINDILASSTANTVFAALTNLWYRAHTNNFTVVAFTITSSLSFTEAQELERMRLNSMIRNSPLLWEYLVDVDAALPNAQHLSLYVDATHLTSAGQKDVAYNVDQVLRRGTKQQTTKYGGEFAGQAIYVNSASYMLNRTLASEVLLKGTYPGIAMDNGTASLLILPIGSAINFYGATAAGNFGGPFMAYNSSGLCVTTNLFTYTLTATNGLVVGTNAGVTIGDNGKLSISSSVSEPKLTIGYGDFNSNGRMWEGNGGNLLIAPGGTAYSELRWGNTPALRTLTNGDVVIYGTLTTSNGVVLAGTTNFITFGATNIAPPISSITPVRWVSVQISGQTNAYRLPLYE